MQYEDYRKAYRTWLFFLVFLTLASGFYIYRIIVERSLNSIMFIIAFMLILIFNYSRIKRMRNKVKEEFKKYKLEILEELK